MSSSSKDALTGRNGTRPHSTLGTRVYEMLQKRILDGEYAPGSVLSKRRLALELKVSVPPVTEALKRLENEGLLKTVPRIGAKITVPSPTEVRRILELREALECQSARLCNQRASNAAKQQLEKMARDLDELTQNAERDPNAMAMWFRRADHELHLKVADFAESERLWELLRQTLTAYQGLANLVSVRNRRAEPDRHYTLVKTVLDGSPNVAELAMRTHVQEALSDLLLSLQDYMVWDEKRLMDIWSVT
jgi:DNA-binding GntR family transcriptional regulator